MMTLEHRALRPRSNMSWIVITFTVLAAWAVLRVFGGERQRQVQDLQAQIMNNALQSAAGAVPPAQKPASR